MAGDPLPACPRCGETRGSRSFADGPNWVFLRYRCGRRVTAGTRFPGDDTGFMRETQKCRRGIWRQRILRAAGHLLPSGREVGAAAVRAVWAGVCYAGMQLSEGYPFLPWALSWGVKFFLLLAAMNFVSRSEKIVNAYVREAVYRSFMTLTGRPYQPSPAVVERPDTTA